MGTSPRFDVAKLAQDIATRGWLAPDLARAAGVSAWTVHRALNGSRMNPRTWDRLARAMGYSVKRYLVSSRSEVP
jgi:hypothetical protein